MNMAQQRARAECNFTWADDDIISAEELSSEVSWSSSKLNLADHILDAHGPAHLAWDNELRSSAESSSRAGAKDRPKTLPECPPEVQVVNSYCGVQDAARKTPDAVGCITRGSGRRGSEKGTKNLSSPAGGETKSIAFDSFIATAGDELLQSAKKALRKAADYVVKQETTALETTMKTSYLNGFKNVSLSGVLYPDAGGSIVESVQECRRHESVLVRLGVARRHVELRIMYTYPYSFSRTLKSSAQPLLSFSCSIRSSADGQVADEVPNRDYSGKGRLLYTHLTV